MTNAEPHLQAQDLAVSLSLLPGAVFENGSLYLRLAPLSATAAVVRT